MKKVAATLENLICYMAESASGRDEANPAF